MSPRRADTEGMAHPTGIKAFLQVQVLLSSRHWGPHASPPSPPPEPVLLVGNAHHPGKGGLRASGHLHSTFPGRPSRSFLTL